MVLDHVRVRVFDDMAIVTFYQNETSRFGDQDSSGRYAFTDVWVKAKWSLAGRFLARHTCRTAVMHMASG